MLVNTRTFAMFLTYPKAKLVRARWMNESERFEMSDVLKSYEAAIELWPK